MAAQTSRFLTAFVIVLPFGLYPVLGTSWNHWATVPASDFIAFFLLGIEEIGIQAKAPLGPFHAPPFPAPPTPCPGNSLVATASTTLATATLPCHQPLTLAVP